MIISMSVNQQQLAYHTNLLIVKIKQAGVPQARSAIAEFGKLSPTLSPGLSTLATFERGGLIRHVMPLARPQKGELDALVPRVAMRYVVASAERVPTDHVSSGVSVIELERNEDLPALQAALANDPSVQFVSRVPIRYLAIPGARIAAAPPPAPTMWNLKKISWADARALPTFKEANNVRVAVLDTGVDVAHPDLAGRVSHYTYQYPDVPVPSGEGDIVGHGTHVSGTIGAIINNDIGINGICTAQIFVWKIFGDQSEFYSMAQGFQYFVNPVMYRRALADCLDAGVDAINLSIGGGGQPDPQEQQLFDALVARGTVVVAAMGNEREAGSPISYPAAIPGVIAVGATNIDDSIASFSNRGDHIALCAPGKAIWSTLPTYPGQFGFEAVVGANGQPIEGRPFRRETDYDAWDGTSMASPHVAGATALLLANRGTVRRGDVRQALMASADKVASMGGKPFDSDYGAGRLNLLRLLSQ